MAINPNVVKENFPSAEKPEQSKTKENSERASRLSQIGEVGQAAHETLGVDFESMETEGRVSEALSENKDQGAVISGTKQTTAQKCDPAKIKEQLLSDLPSEKILRKQIEKEIRKEIDYLHKKAMKMMASPGQMNYFEMSNVVRKIRDLKALLLSLVKASVDTLKTLWIRYVHGLM